MICIFCPQKYPLMSMARTFEAVLEPLHSCKLVTFETIATDHWFQETWDYISVDDSRFYGS